VALRASVGRGFRAPDFKELYLAFANSAVGYAVAGNPELLPERSTNGQIGIEWNVARGWVRVNGFVNRFEDFIAVTQDEATGVFTYRNLETGETRGVEVEGTVHRPGGWRVDVGYTYLDARDGAGRPLPSRTPHSGRAALTVPLPRRGSMAASWVITGPTPTAVGLSLEPTAMQPTFDRLDLTLTTPLRSGLRVLVGAENVFDRQLGQDWPGFTGRLVFAGLRWSGD
jgi:outer membrane receptor for ferrienterochelin and colicins